MKLRNIHLIVGVVVLFIFLLTGMWMKSHHLGEAIDRIRFSVRANHLYILFLGLLNLAVATRAEAQAFKARLQLISSLMVLAATSLAIYAFFYEDKMPKSRPMILLTAILASLGIILQTLSSFKRTT